MPTDYIPTLTHATERDIDLILVEELYANHEFVVWVAAQAGIFDVVASWDVKHSKRRTQSRREIDIFVELTDSKGHRHAILIENKLDAEEQPDQAESYREELRVLRASYTKRVMLLVCPVEYANKHSFFVSKFDAVVSYEALRGFFDEMQNESGSELFLRARLRRELFDQAIEKHRRGYTPVLDKAVGDFNAKYVALLRELHVPLFPGNSMLKPANPRESTSMIFDQAKSLAELPTSLRPRRFSHELGRGSESRANYVAATFKGWGVIPVEVQKKFETDVASISGQISAKKPTKSRPNPGLVLSVPTRPVDNQGSFETQRSDLIDGIKAACELRNWLIANQNLLSEWHRIVKTFQ